MFKDFFILLIEVQRHFIVRHFDFHSFIAFSISSGVENVKTTLTSAGFQELKENEQWNIQPSGKVNS